MARHYFDLRDGNELVIDEEGLELRDMQAVQRKAALALSGFARNAGTFNGAQSHQMAIVVRDEDGHVVEVRFSFEIIRTR